MNVRLTSNLLFVISLKVMFFYVAMAMATDDHFLQQDLEFQKELERLGLSARVARRLLRVARTIADLAKEEKTGPRALAEALSYRATELGSTSAAEAAANRYAVALRVHGGV